MRAKSVRDDMGEARGASWGGIDEIQRGHRSRGDAWMVMRDDVMRLGDE